MSQITHQPEIGIVRKEDEDARKVEKLFSSFSKEDEDGTKIYYSICTKCVGRLIVKIQKDTPVDLVTVIFTICEFCKQS